MCWNLDPTKNCEYFIYTLWMTLPCLASPYFPSRSLQDPLVHHDHHFGHTVHSFCSVQTLLTNGIVSLAEESEAESLSAVYVNNSLHQQTNLFRLQTLQFPPSCASLYSLGRLADSVQGCWRSCGYTPTLPSLANYLTTVHIYWESYKLAIYQTLFASPLLLVTRPSISNEIY